MCLYTDEIQTLKFLNKHKNHKTVTVYKNLIIEEQFLVSPYYCMQYKIGKNVSNSKAKLNLTDNRKISLGIHVYETKKRAMYNRSYNETVCKFTANISDLIGVSHTHLVFKKVYLSQSEYNRILKG